jgi:hypothetical protein
MSYVRTSGNIVEQIQYEWQAEATLNQDNPVAGTLYTVLDTTKNVRIIGMSANVTWSAQPSNVTIVVTCDGKTLNFDCANPASATDFFAFLKEYASQIGASYGMDSAAAYIRTRSFLLEGKTVKIQAKVTGGTSSNLKVRVLYAKRVG